MTTLIDEFAKKHCDGQYDLGKREAYLNQHRYAFDSKGLEAFAEEYLIARLGDPVAWIEDRTDLIPDPIADRFKHNNPEHTIPLYTLKPAKQQEVSINLEDFIVYNEWLASSKLTRGKCPISEAQISKIKEIVK